MIVVIVVIFLSPTHPSPQPPGQFVTLAPPCHLSTTTPPGGNHLTSTSFCKQIQSREDHIQSQIENHLTFVTFWAILQTHLIPYLLLGKMSLSCSQQKYCPSRSHVAVPEYPRPKFSSLGHSNQSELFHTPFLSKIFDLCRKNSFWWRISFTIFGFATIKKVPSLPPSNKVTLNAVFL